jgi:hypothetical protein
MIQRTYVALRIAKSSGWAHDWAAGWLDIRFRASIDWIEGSMKLEPTA